MVNDHGRGMPPDDLPWAISIAQRQSTGRVGRGEVAVEAGPAQEAGRTDPPDAGDNPSLSGWWHVSVPIDEGAADAGTQTGPGRQATIGTPPTQPGVSGHPGARVFVCAERTGLPGATPDERRPRDDLPWAISIAQRQSTGRQFVLGDDRT
jgi:hypothetical protein